MSKETSLSILQGRLIDPANQIDQVTDLHIAKGRILAIGQTPPGFEADKLIQANNLIVCPGLVDMSVRLREPGLEHKATIASETLAAAKSGITTLCCMPDTDPAIDTPAVVELIRRTAKNNGNARVMPIGALTQGLEGSKLSEMAALKDAGCIAVSNADSPLANTLVERRALEYAGTYGLLVYLRAEDKHLRNQGCVHEGPIANRLGLPGIPSVAESVAVARDLALASHTQTRIHFHGISTAAAVDMLSQARQKGLQVSADVAAHQLHLTEHDLEGFNSQCHVNPPLRSQPDCQALRQAVASGVISAICSDHQPHEEDAKLAPFAQTQAGISGLETLLPLTLKLVEDGLLTLPEAIARLTCDPAKILGIPAGTLGLGKKADICIFDPEQPWVLNPQDLISEGKNTPFGNWHFQGRIQQTLLQGKTVYKLKKS